MKNELRDVTPSLHIISREILPEEEKKTHWNWVLCGVYVISWRFVLNINTQGKTSRRGKTKRPVFTTTWAGNGPECTAAPSSSWAPLLMGNKTVMDDWTQQSVSNKLCQLQLLGVTVRNAGKCRKSQQVEWKQPKQLILFKTKGFYLTCFRQKTGGAACREAAAALIISADSRIQVHQLFLSSGWNNCDFPPSFLCRRKRRTRLTSSWGIKDQI